MSKAKGKVNNGMASFCYSLYTNESYITMKIMQCNAMANLSHNIKCGDAIYKLDKGEDSHQYDHLDCCTP